MEFKNRVDSETLLCNLPPRQAPTLPRPLSHFNPRSPPFNLSQNLFNFSGPPELAGTPRFDGPPYQLIHKGSLFINCLHM